MPMPFTCKPLPQDAERVPVSGISEWEHVFYMLPDKQRLPERPVEDCIDTRPATSGVAKLARRASLVARPKKDETERSWQTSRTSFSFWPTGYGLLRHRCIVRNAPGLLDCLEQPLDWTALRE